MEESDLRQVHKLYEALNRRDFDAVMEGQADDVEWEIGMGTFRGKAEVRGWIKESGTAWAELRIEVEKVIDAADKLVAFVEFSARGLRSGVALDQRPAHVITLRGGKITRLTSYRDRRQALEAAGLSE